MDRAHGTGRGRTRRLWGRSLWLTGLLLVAGLAGCLTDENAGGPEGSQGAGGEAVVAWEAFPALPTPRTEVASVVSDGRLVVLGGFEEGNVQSTVVEALDLDEQTWRELARLPVPLHHLAAVDHEGTLHVLGGHMGIPFVPTSTHLVLEPGAATWTMATPLPTPRGAHDAAVVDGQAYLVGGVGPQGLEPSVDVYDLEAGTWSQAGDLPTLREHLAVASVDGQVFAMGGRTGGLDTNLATLEVLTPGEGWSSGPEMPTARGGIRGAGAGGMAWAVGGEAPDGTFGEVEAFDPVTEAWEQMPPLPTPRHGLGVAGWGDQLYAAAGGPQPGLTVSDAVGRLQVAGPGTPR